MAAHFYLSKGNDLLQSPTNNCVLQFFKCSVREQSRGVQPVVRGKVGEEGQSQPLSCRDLNTWKSNAVTFTTSWEGQTGSVSLVHFVSSSAFSTWQLQTICSSRHRACRPLIRWSVVQSMISPCWSVHGQDSDLSRRPLIGSMMIREDGWFLFYWSLCHTLEPMA